jgi:hypothetical protein
MEPGCPCLPRVSSNGFARQVPQIVPFPGELAQFRAGPAFAHARSSTIDRRRSENARQQKGITSMKNLKTLLLSTFAAPLAVGTAARADDPVAHPLVPVSVSSVYAPGGFDENDESQVVVDGYLPSTCYRLSHNVAKLDPATGEFKVTQFARKFTGLCIPAKVPFFSEVNLGVLPAATYKIGVRGADAESLAVKEALSGGPDDYLYAPIDWAAVKLDGATRRYVATIAGRLTSSCMRWDDVKVLDQGKVIVLLPILKTSDGTGCTSVETPFERTVVLPETMAEARHLLHVRSLNGKAVNTMFTVGARDPGDNE